MILSHDRSETSGGIKEATELLEEVYVRVAEGLRLRERAGSRDDKRELKLSLSWEFSLLSFAFSSLRDSASFTD